MTNVLHVVADLEWAAERWIDLTEARLPGTARPARPSKLTPERRAELDFEARIERLERTGLAPGESPAPVDVGILDTMTSILPDAELLAEHAARAARAPILAPSTSAYADAAPYLRYAAACLPVAVDAWTNGRDMLSWAAGLARSVREELTQALALAWDGQSIRVVCPWCRGGWFGDRTWWVRVLPGDIIAVVCESGVCNPPQGDVGTWLRSDPVWPMPMWSWLARRVQAAEARHRPAPVASGDYGLLSGRA